MRRASSACCRFCWATVRALPAREMLINNPISASNIKRLVPPEEKNGRLMPVLGSSAVLTPMWQNICHATCAVMPMPSMAPK